MTKDDTHDCCLVCLGYAHDMKNCEQCRALQLRTRVERARAMLLWQKGVTSWPLSRRNYEERRKLGHFEGLDYLNEDYIHYFLGVGPHPRNSEYSLHSNSLALQNGPAYGVLHNSSWTEARK